MPLLKRTTIQANELTSYATIAGVYLITLIVLFVYHGLEGHIHSALLALPLIWVTCRDWVSYEVPDLGSVSIALIGFVHIASKSPSEAWMHVGVGALTLFLFWSMGEVYFRWAGHEGLGIGDAKLLGAGAVVVGPWLMLELIFVASVGGIIAIMIRTWRINSLERGIPFAPFICYSILLSSFEGQTMV